MKREIRKVGVMQAPDRFAIEEERNAEIPDSPQSPRVRAKTIASRSDEVLFWLQRRLLPPQLQRNGRPAQAGVPAPTERGAPVKRVRQWLETLDVRAQQQGRVGGSCAKYSDSLNNGNSVPYISLISDLLCNGPMKKIGEIRRANLARAVALAGTAAALGRLAEIDPAYFSQIKTGAPDSKTGKAKEMGDAVARKIESAIGMPIGWMDADHDDARPSLRIHDIAHEELLRDEFFEKTLSPQAQALIEEIRGIDRAGASSKTFEALIALIRSIRWDEKPALGAGD